MAEESTIPTRRKRPTTREGWAVKNTLDAGGWIPAQSETVARLLKPLIESGAELSRDEAILDAIYWADKGTWKPAAYYAERWKWSKTTAWRLLKELGMEQPEVETKSGDSDTESASDETQTPAPGVDDETPMKRRRNADETEHGESGSKSAPDETPMKRSRNADETVSPDCHTTEGGTREKKEGDARTRETDTPPDPDYPGRSIELDSGGDDPDPGEGVPPPAPVAPEQIPEGWTGETIGILRTWTTWQGRAMPAPFQQVIRQLMQPRGSPAGARYGNDTRMHNGYTAAEIERAIEQFSMDSHHSPSSLIGHVIGEIEPRANKGNRRKHGKQDAGSGNGTANGKHSGDLESFREKTERRIAARRRREGRGDGDVDTPKGDARRLAVSLDHGPDQP